MRVFEINDLTKRYDGMTNVNENINLHIEAGTIRGIFGPNGAGKTTLIRQMLGLLKPTQGKVMLFGVDVSGGQAAIPTRVGYLPQNAHALWDFTVRESLYYTGRLRGMAHDAAQQQANDLINVWQLHDLRDRLIRRLSGGQQRLAQLAGILMGDPDVMVLDEPTNHMDPSYRRMVWAHLRKLNRERGATIVLVTHNLLEAQSVVMEMAIINHGRLIAQGTPAQLQASLDDRVYIDMVWRVPDPSQVAIMAQINATQVDSLRWRLTVPQVEVDAAMAQITTYVCVSELAELRVHTVSLEEYYLAMTEDDTSSDLEQSPHERS